MLTIYLGDFLYSIYYVLHFFLFGQDTHDFSGIKLVDQRLDHLHYDFYAFLFVCMWTCQVFDSVISGDFFSTRHWRVTRPRQVPIKKKRRAKERWAFYHCGFSMELAGWSGDIWKCWKLCYED